MHVKIFTGKKQFRTDKIGVALNRVLLVCVVALFRRIELRRRPNIVQRFDCIFVVLTHKGSANILTLFKCTSYLSTG